MSFETFQLEISELNDDELKQLAIVVMAEVFHSFTRAIDDTEEQPLNEFRNVFTPVKSKTSHRIQCQISASIKVSNYISWVKFTPVYYG